MRVVAAAVLIFGPWADEPEELQGWDVERFQEIADTAGTPYVDHEVEYPPLTVAVAEVVLADEVVSSHQRLVVLSLAVDLTVAAALARFFGHRAGVAYLLIGLPLVPSGLLRLDLWAALAAVIGAVAIARPRSSSTRHDPTLRDAADGTPNAINVGVFAALVTVGAMVKLWPALLIPAAIAIKNLRAAAAAAIVGACSGLIWLAISGTPALEQITSLRGVTGWHLESIPGSLIALFGSDEPRLEANAFRIGDLDDTLVLIGRLLVFALVATATALAHRSEREPADRLALVMLASVAGLIITAPLFSPQFLLWLTPWAAMLHRDRTVTRLTFAAIALTATVLAVFGPPGLDHPVAAAGLLLRDGLMLAIIGIALRRLALRRLATSDGLEHV